jgi:hypothetical protein
MLHSKGAWEAACELARSGNYANVVMIERELRRRDLLGRGESIATSILRRELLTRACHAARNGVVDDFSDSDADPRAFRLNPSPDAA